MDFCVNVFSPTKTQLSKNLSWFENKNLFKITFYWKKGFELIPAIFFSLGVCAKNISSYFVSGKQKGGRGRVPEKKIVSKLTKMSKCIQHLFLAFAQIK